MVKKALKQDLKMVDGQVMPPPFKHAASNEELLDLYTRAYAHYTEGWGKPARAWEALFNQLHKEVIKRMQKP